MTTSQVSMFDPNSFSSLRYFWLVIDYVYDVHATEWVLVHACRLDPVSDLYYPKGKPHTCILSLQSSGTSNLPVCMDSPSLSPPYDGTYTGLLCLFLN